MIKFVPSTIKDVEQIQQWTDADEYHRGQHNPAWWLTGKGFLSFCLYDDKGPVCYVRMDEGEYVKLSVQFAPIEIVSKMHLARAIFQAFPKLIEIAKSARCKGIIFNSISPSLIHFMYKFGFDEAGDNSYVLTFRE